jgi:alkylation response protein AidB-like acyl-CoA dehydrogenase
MSAQRAGRSAEQEQFAASLHDMLAAADVPGAARRWAGGDHSGGLALWRKLAGAGVTALAVPEKWGGLGAGPLDTVVACEELGHHALPGPVAESVAVVPGLIAALADAAAFPALGDALPRLAAGDLIATLALPPWLPYAPDADVAGLVLLAETGTTKTHAEAGTAKESVVAGLVLPGETGTSGTHVLWLAEPGARHRSVDRARSLSEVSRREVLARGPAVASAVAQAFQAGALASAAQLLGAGRGLLAASVRHAGQRIQFGRPVGAFQAVKHHLADVAIGLEFARPLLDAAAIALAAGDPCAARDVSAAKVACTEAARRAARAALQVHGAIGYTEEHDLHLWLMKVRALAGTWGSQAEHRGRIMAELTAPDAPPWN